MARPQLKALSEAGLYRQLDPLPAPGTHIERRPDEFWLNLSSNDYLGLSKHPKVIAASLEATERLGTSASASRLTSGHLDLHHGFEAQLAQFFGFPSALVLGSGYLANIGALTSLIEAEDWVFFDRLNHASLIDGIRQTRAHWHRYRHGDMDGLERLLQQADAKAQRWIVTDSVFSMDGDTAPLQDIVALAQRYHAKVFLDESHAVGVIGPSGQGLAAKLALKVDVISSGMGKALGSYGGFVLSSAENIQKIINRARCFIYSTGLPPATIAAASASVHELSQHGNTMVQALQHKAQHFVCRLQDGGLSIPAVPSAIVPILIGDNHETLRVAESLHQMRIIATAIRPPTVPAGSARLRLTVCLPHSLSELDHVADALIKLQLGELPPGLRTDGEAGPGWPGL